MKLPITDEVINAPAQYVGIFFYKSGLSIPATQTALDEQCNEMLARHIESGSFEDFPEYIDWVRRSGKVYINALEQDFMRNQELWKKEPNVFILQARIRDVMKAGASTIRIYAND